jgi:beta-glucosidase
MAKKPESPMDLFVTDLMNRMTPEEKIGQLNLVTPGGYTPTGAVVSENVEEKIRNGEVGGIFGLYSPATVRPAQEMAVKESRLGIPLIFGLDVIHGHKTIFPIPLALSCTWDMALIERSARLAAREATADGLQWVFSPMVDIARDARWGRIAEGAGEDPWLGSRIAEAMVRGYQGDDLSASNTAMACVKHFALYGGSEAGRDYNTVDISRINMYNYYLHPYKAAIEAGAGSLMTSFNVVDAVPATANRWLLTELLRSEWGFEGLVITDYTSINEMIPHGLGDLQQVSALSMQAGVDMDMVGEGFLTTLKKSLEEGKVSQDQIDLACRNVLEAKYKLGLFDDPYRYLDDARPAADILTAEHRSFAREAAARSMVLLKNFDQLLPLKKSGTLALVGPLADHQADMLGTWVIAGDARQAVTMRKGLEAALAGSAMNMIYAKGANVTDDPYQIRQLSSFMGGVEVDLRSPEQLRAEAVAAARRSDVVVAVLGESLGMSGEAASRSDIGIPASQRLLLEALVATGKPVVLVLVSGRPLTLLWENDQVEAMLMAWAPGTEAGHAIADVLFGAYNPAGKLTATFPRTVGQIPLYYNHLPTGRPAQIDPKFASKYLDIPNEPLFPFGFGLSYTSFVYGDVELSKSILKADEQLTVGVVVSNSGTLAGEEVVQLYLSDPVASISRPVKELKGFQKIMLQPGESKKVEFVIDTEDLKFFNSNLEYDWEPGGFTVHIGTNSVEVKSANVVWDK